MTGYGRNWTCDFRLKVGSFFLEEVNEHTDQQNELANALGELNRGQVIVSHGLNRGRSRRRRRGDRAFEQQVFGIAGDGYVVEAAFGVPDRRCRGAWGRG